MEPLANARSFINGSQVLTERTQLQHGDRIVYGVTITTLELTSKRRKIY